MSGILSSTLLGLAVSSALVPAARALKTGSPELLVFPPPRSIVVTEGALSVTPTFSFYVDPTCATSPRLVRAIARFSARMQLLAKDSGAPFPLLSTATVCVSSPNDTVSSAVDYSYSVRIRYDSAQLGAASVFGAIYAMESFSQLFTPGNVLPAGSVDIDDAPLYSWRGIMLDAGRRFFPVSTVQNLLDTMESAKLNVLHWHLSDECRFGVESKLFPNLTDALSGVLGGFYSQDDVTALVSYASDRGIRIMPEFDIPGHSRGFIPIQDSGVVFCDPQDATRSQLYGDPQNKTLMTLTALFREMAGLFPDPVFHIGSDETSALGPCTTQSTFALERAVLNYVQSSVGKTPAGWEEVLFDAGAATPETVVFSWARHPPYEIAITGRQVVASNDSHWYFTDPAPGGPAGWDACWYDPGTGLNATLLPLLLGGEMSMWTDTYCYISQCGASSGATPVGAALFPPESDYAFGPSIGGMIFPRGFVGAAAFWNYNASIDPSSPAFVSAVDSLNDAVNARGGFTCPTNCSCDELTACGTPYLKPRVPQLGDTLSGTTCLDPVDPSQAWALTAQGTLSPRSNASLCVLVPGYNIYPLPLGLCSDPTAAVWRHDPATSEIIQVSTGNCLDLMTSTSELGTYDCGSNEGLHQANQQWALDSTSGLVVSLFAGGGCATALAPTAA